MTYTGSVRGPQRADISRAPQGPSFPCPCTLETQSGRADRAQLDTAKSGKAAQADAQAGQALLGAHVALLTHHLHHRPRSLRHGRRRGRQRRPWWTPRPRHGAAQDAVADAQAGRRAPAERDYWKTEIVREKQLADAGAASPGVSRRTVPAQAADAALTQALSKVHRRRRGRRVPAPKHPGAAGSDGGAGGDRDGQADLVIAAGQADQEAAGAVAALGSSA